MPFNIPKTFAIAAALALTTSCSTTDNSGPSAVTAADLNTVHLRVDFNKQIRTVIIELDPGAAPNTVGNFKTLLAKRFYDGLAFHRAVPDYLVQTGDPLTAKNSKIDSWGTSGPGYTIPFEKGLNHKRGVVSMARLGDSVNPDRNSNGSQFFICLADLPDLNGQYAAFGRVTQGMEILDEMAALARDRNDVPKRRVQIVSMGLTSSDTLAARKQQSMSTDTVRAKVPETEKGFLGRTLDRLW
jgi:cyclophilin family peptidyl-prolyl cis-trans isomerase